MVLEEIFVSKGVKVVFGVEFLSIVGNVVVENSDSSLKVGEKSNSNRLVIVVLI